MVLESSSPPVSKKWPGGPVTRGRGAGTARPAAEAALYPPTHRSTVSRSPWPTDAALPQPYPGPPQAHIHPSYTFYWLGPDTWHSRPTAAGHKGSAIKPDEKLPPHNLKSHCSNKWFEVPVEKSIPSPRAGQSWTVSMSLQLSDPRETAHVLGFYTRAI